MWKNVATSHFTPHSLSTTWECDLPGSNATRVLPLASGAVFGYSQDSPAQTGGQLAGVHTLPHTS